MQDNEKQVLAALVQLTGTGDTFKVLEADEILGRLPEGTVMDKQALGAVIRELRGTGYLDVKYLTPDEYCLLVSPRAEEALRPLHEEEPRSADTPQTPVPQRNEETVRKKAREYDAKTAPKLFAIVLAGSMLGGMIVAALAIILQKFAL